MRWFFAALLAITLSALLLVNQPADAADPQLDELTRGPVSKDWVTNGGNLTNQRFSTLKQINLDNVKQLKGAWMTRLKGSGFGGKYSLEATPLVKDGVMYVVTGNDDVFALNAKTGAIIWERWSGIDQKISTVCCGWANRGLAMGEGKLFLGQLDANVVALDIKTGQEVWKTPIEKWQDGYGVTSAPLYYDGIIYSGITGGEFGTRGRLTALDAASGKILWRWYTTPAPGEPGSESWPKGSDISTHGGATIWNTPALDPDLGLIYFATGNCGPDYDGSVREGDNLYCASIVALKAKTGEYVWHFQQVHHDMWDYDAASPVVLFDITLNGQPRKALGEAGRTGWVYLLDRTNGQPLVGIEEKPVPQEPRQKTAKTQPFPVGDAVVPQCAEPMPGYEKAGCIFQAYWEEPVLIQPSGIGGVNWAPMAYNPELGLFYVGGTVRTSAFTRYNDTFKLGKRYFGGSQAAPIGSAMSGTFTALAGNTNKIAWQNKTPYRLGAGSGATATAGGLVLHGEPDGNFLAIDAKTGKELWRFQTGFGADAPAMTYEVDGEQYIAIATGGNSLSGTPYGDAVWAFSLKGQLSPLWPPPPPAKIAGPTGPIMQNPEKINIGANNVEYSFFPGRVKIKAGTKLNFTNVGDIPHTATAIQKGGWDTGLLTKGQSKEIQFSEPGTYYYICTPHPWMYGQIIVE